MSTNLYVGNLAFQVTSETLREMFEPFGVVTSASVMIDRESGRSRGFGFVDMSKGGEAAIEGLNGTDFAGRTLTVDEARPRAERTGGNRRERC